MWSGVLQDLQMNAGLMCGSYHFKMYELSVEKEFCAAHALVLNGAREVVHGHNFRVTLTLSGRELDGDGLLVDFHDVERALDDILKPLTNADLNAARAFQGVNPSAEHIAKHIAESVQARLGSNGRARVTSCRVTEAPGCSVTYRLESASEGFAGCMSAGHKSGAGLPDKR